MLVQQSQLPGTDLKLGEILQEQGLINQEQLDMALSIARSQGKRLGQALTELGLIDAFSLNSALSVQFGMPSIDLQTEPISPDALRIVPD